MRIAIVILATCGLAAMPARAQQPFPWTAVPSPPPGTIYLYPERILTDDGTLVDAERGLLFVPMNRADTSRGVVAVEIWRFPAERPRTSPPVFRLPGGPGFEGLEGDIREGYYERIVRSYTAFTDFVVVGQRGIGASKPGTLCLGGSGPAAFSTRCRTEWEARGLDITGFNVLEAAADVADAAAALGYDAIVLRGGSFGSHWATAVMWNHPDLVAWAVLSGTEGPDHTYDSPTGILRAMRRMADAAESAPGLAPLIPEGGLIGALHTVRARLTESPVVVTITDDDGGEHAVEFTVADLPDLADGYTASLGSRRGVAQWPADVLRLYYGDFATAARTRLARLARAEVAGDRVYVSSASEYLLDCASGATPERLAALRADTALALVWGEFTWYEEICGPWGVDVGNAFRRDFATEIPTVIVHGTWDMNTPYDNALELLPRFRRGRLVTVDGGSHGALGEAYAADSSFAAAFWTFLRTGDVTGFADSVVLPPLEWEVPDDLRALAAPAPARRH